MLITNPVSQEVNTVSSVRLSVRPSVCFHSFLNRSAFELELLYVCVAHHYSWPGI